MNKLVIANRLPIETQIAKAFGVSRISVSEASKSLEFLGIVEKKAEWQLGMNSPVTWSICSPRRKLQRRQKKCESIWKDFCASN